MKAPATRLFPARPGGILLCGVLLLFLFPGPAEAQSQQGQQLFQQNCAHCHNEDALGDGPMHTRFIPHPANLTLVQDTPTMALSIVMNGVPGTPMPGFKAKLDRQKFDQIWGFIRSQPYATEREWDFPWQGSQAPPNSNLGPTIYTTACMGCHGDQGGGDGPWASGDPAIWPKPADFRARNSDPGRLFHIIKHGREGTYMAPQGDKFPDMALWALAEHVHGLFDAGSNASIPEPSGQTSVTNPVSPDDAMATQRGKDTYDLYCVACHNAQGRGSFLAPKLIDREWRYGGGTDTAVFKVVEKGIPGKLMPGHKSIDTQRRWEIIAWLRHHGGLPEPLAPGGQGGGQ